MQQGQQNSPLCSVRGEDMQLACIIPPAISTACRRLPTRSADARKAFLWRRCARGAQGSFESAASRSGLAFRTASCPDAVP